jgi:formate hydrogenlyase subunit 4
MHWAVVFATAPFFIGVITKVKAFFGGKVGAPLLQPYFDIAKLLRKGTVYSRTTTWVFRAAPAVSLSAAAVVILFVPLGGIPAAVRFDGDIFFAAYVLALSRFFMITAALATGFSMEGMGASREAFFSCLCEAALFMNFITLALLTRSVSFAPMLGADAALPWIRLGSALLLVVASLFIVLLAENCRIPVDDPDTHLELTMIHEVMILDHSGADLAYLLYASAIKFFVFASILIAIVLPGSTGNYAKDTAIFFCGMTGLAVVVAVVESTMARLRLSRVKDLLLIAFVLAFFGCIVAMWRG